MLPTVVTPVGRTGPFETTMGRNSTDRAWIWDFFAFSSSTELLLAYRWTPFETGHDELLDCALATNALISRRLSSPIPLIPFFISISWICLYKLTDIRGCP